MRPARLAPWAAGASPTIENPRRRGRRSRPGVAPSNARRESGGADRRRRPRATRPAAGSGGRRGSPRPGRVRTVSPELIGFARLSMVVEPNHVLPRWRRPAWLLAGCGGGSAGTTSRQGEREANVALARYGDRARNGEVDAYDHGLSLLGGQPASAGPGDGHDCCSSSRAQDQEHVDALLKAVRGLGGKVDPVKVAGEREALKYRAVKTRDDFLALAYELESKGVVGDLDEVARLLGRLAALDDRLDCDQPGPAPGPAAPGPRRRTARLSSRPL